MVNEAQPHIEWCSKLEFMARLVTHPEFQKDLMEASGEPAQDAAQASAVSPNPSTSESQRSIECLRSECGPAALVLVVRM